MSFNKILEIDEYFKSSSGFEPSIQLVHSTKSVKVASEASEWSTSIKPEPGSTFILVLAMGASEYYGPNRNGDAFRESELKKKYKTFETNAHVFRSHVNKDPAKSMGSVVKAFYNEDMHRVELVLKLVDSKCPDIVDKIRQGENVAVSMGCKIEYDVCTICGNKAPSRKEYCDHLLNELNEIYPDGRIVAADNPDPNFFDISVVYKPADKTGYMLKKVASVGSGYSRETGELSSAIAEKVAAKTAIAKYLLKAADIDKIVTGVGFSTSSSSKPELSNSTKSVDKDDLAKKWLVSIVPKITQSFVPIDSSDIASMAQRDLPKVLATLSDMGIFLTTPEFLDLVFVKMTGNKAPEGLSEKLISLQGDIFRLLAKHPDIAAEVITAKAMPNGSESADKDLASKMSSYYPFRSLKSDNILRQSKSINYVGDTSARPYTASRQVVKVATQALAAYKSYIADFTKSAGYRLLPHLVGDASRIQPAAMPWAPYTVVALDTMLVPKNSAAFSKTSAILTLASDRITSRSLAEDIVADLLTT
jgi:hypothetical protein